MAPTRAEDLVAFAKSPGFSYEFHTPPVHDDPRNGNARHEFADRINSRHLKPDKYMRRSVAAEDRQTVAAGGTDHSCREVSDAFCNPLGIARFCPCGQHGPTVGSYGMGKLRDEILL